MDDNIITVKQLQDYLANMPEDALVYRVETIDGEMQDTYFAVTHVWEKDGNVMIY